MRQGITIDKKIMRQGIMWKDAFESSHETMDFGKILCDRIYIWGIFYATGYRVWRDFPHTPVTSLVKYPVNFEMSPIVNFHQK